LGEAPTEPKELETHLLGYAGLSVGFHVGRGISVRSDNLQSQYIYKISHILHLAAGGERASVRQREREREREREKERERERAS
jgi:hypothetical protein